MTGTQLAALIRRKTKTNSTTYSDANLLVDVNLMKDEIAIRIQKVRQKMWNIPTLDDLVADQREYPVPEDILNNIDNLELKFSATGDYVKAEFISRRHYGDTLQESKIINSFDNLEPRYFIRRQAIYILSGAIIAVTDGLRLVYNSFPADLSSLTGTSDLSLDPSTTTHGFPREFHELWARRVSIEYKSREPGMKLSERELNYDIDLDKALDDFSTVDLSKQIVSALPSSDKRGDEGYNY